MSNLLVFDTETSGLDTEINDLLEIAFQAISITGEPIGKLVSTFVYCDKPIPKEASDINNITLDMLINAPKVEGVISLMEKHCVEHKCSGIMAHNAPFDINTMNKYLRPDSPLRDLEIIDTLRLARRVYPLMDSHKLGDMCSELGLESESFVGDYHSAGFDIAQTIELYKDLMENLYDIDTFEELITYHDTPIVLTTMPFGKHKGLPFDFIPKSYIGWLCSIDVDIDLKETLKHI